jgi:hypothetical protein
MEVIQARGQWAAFAADRLAFERLKQPMPRG